VHFAVAVPVGNEEFAAARMDRDVRALVEGPAAHWRRGFSRRPDRQQDFAVECALADRVIKGVS
jgi:hypothetical protein